MKTSWLVPVALALFLSAPASGKTPRSEKAPARSSGIYSQQVYEGARESLAAAPGRWRCKSRPAHRKRRAFYPGAKCVDNR